MVRWYDGLYGGLVAGCTVAMFYAGVSVAWLHETSLGGFFAEIASGILGPRADAGNGWAVAFGVALHFVTAATFGMFYALVAARIPSMWQAPYSVLWGLSYGAIVWFAIADGLVPLLGIVSTQAWWEGGIANTVFYGLVLSEFITTVRRMKAFVA